MTIFDEIRAACRHVAENAALVRIDDAMLAAYARDFPLSEIGKAGLDPATHHLGRGEETLAFILVLDTINFGSGYFPHLKKRPNMSGYFTVAAGLNDWFKRDGAPDARHLASLEPADCAQIFGQDADNHDAAALMTLFARALNDLGALLLARHGGSYARLVESAGNSAADLVTQLRLMPCFDDVALWHGRQVPILKRAQITAADLALAFEHAGWGRFDDAAEITIFADNLVPHVLRVDGVLTYAPALSQHIDAGLPLTAGSTEEVEIRAVALHAVERLKALLHQAGHPNTTSRQITSVDLDYLLWNQGQDARYKAVPRHRAKSVFY
jgi:hypothetical protein